MTVDLAEKTDIGSRSGSGGGPGGAVVSRPHPTVEEVATVGTLAGANAGDAARIEGYARRVIEGALATARSV